LIILCSAQTSGIFLRIKLFYAKHSGRGAFTAWLRAEMSASGSLRRLESLPFRGTSAIARPMKNRASFLVFPFLFVTLFEVRSEDSIQFRQTYSRGDDDLAYSYSTANLQLELSLRRKAKGFEAQLSFAAYLTTAEAQGFAESARFGMREAERFLTSEGQKEARSVQIATQPVVFKFIQPGVKPATPDRATQQSADALSDQFFRTRQAIPGNRPEAKGKTLAGTLALGILSEGEHRGTVFVQQLVGQSPSATDADISVRHLIPWYAKIENGKIYIEIQNGRYFASDAGLEIAAPSWDGAVRPHRVALLKDEVVIEGKVLPSGKARIGVPFPEKGVTLLRQDKEEFRKEFTPRERLEIFLNRRRGR
jgi:hypothetical protein